jgi:hypothetical protein
MQLFGFFVTMYLTNPLNGVPSPFRDAAVAKTSVMWQHHTYYYYTASQCRAFCIRLSLLIFLLSETMFGFLLCTVYKCAEIRLAPQLQIYLAETRGNISFNLSTVFALGRNYVQSIADREFHIKPR